MPATPVVIDTIPGAYSTVGQQLTVASCDAVNGNSVAITSGELILLLVRNTSGSSQSFTITSQPDPVTGRLGNVNTTVAAGARKLFQLTAVGWASGGLITFNGPSSLEVSAFKF